ncbi:MAG: hypothetical protein U0168_02660 [Nannocystaceae bacterium]
MTAILPRRAVLPSFFCHTIDMTSSWRGWTTRMQTLISSRLATENALATLPQPSLS